MSSLQPSQTPADLLRRIRELAAEAPVEDVTDQNVVSKVILKRFAADDAWATCSKTKDGCS